MWAINKGLQPLVLFESKFALADVGKSVWYIARYINTRGNPGPWSNAVSAAVA